MLLMLALPAGAEIYKWTDASGKVHYGDQPPNPGTTTQITPRNSRAAEAAGEALRHKAAEQAVQERLKAASSKEDAAKKQTAAAEEARRKAEQCDRARKNYTTLTTQRGRIARVDAQGQRVYLDDATREAETTRSNQEIAEFCR
jgi:FKBP-type peptidyl-prolyl cis-trans isomerase